MDLRILKQTVSLNKLTSINFTEVESTKLCNARSLQCRTPKTSVRQDRKIKIAAFGWTCFLLHEAFLTQLFRLRQKSADGDGVYLTTKRDITQESCVRLTLCLLFFACSCCALVSRLYSTSYSCCPLTCLLILLNSTLYLSLPITSVKFLQPVAFYLGLLAPKIAYFLPLPIFLPVSLQISCFHISCFSHIYLHSFLLNIFYFYLPPTLVFLFTCNFLSIFFFHIYFSYFLSHLPPFAFNFLFLSSISALF